MSRILVMSSWTSAGHVGLSAAAPVLQALGHEVTQLPTIILSNHRGLPHSAGEEVTPSRLAEMVDAIDANGLLAGHDALLTGYLPSPGHVDLARDLVHRLSRPGPRPKVVVDPILGDDPKGPYLPEEVAVAMGKWLVPLADVLTPNCFELGWLTGQPVESLEEARAAARLLGGELRREVLVTSPPLPDGDTGVLAVGPQGEALFRTRRLSKVPNGAGDAFSALIAAGLTVGAALGHLRALVEASSGADHLAIVTAADHWTRASEIASVRLPGAEE